MNAADAQKLARRFIELPQDKRRLFLAGMAREGIDFAQLPMTACDGIAERDGLSYAQQRMWFLWQLDPHSAAYNLPMAVRLTGDVASAGAGAGVQSVGGAARMLAHHLRSGG